MNDTSRRMSDLALTYAVLLALLLFGVAQAVVGTFFYFSGPVPLAAIGFDLVLFGTCLLGGWGLRSGAGAFVVAVGWAVTVFLFGRTSPSGSFLITTTTAGEVFLFGGAAAAAVGLVLSFRIWSRRK